METKRSYLKNAILSGLESKLTVYGFKLNKFFPGFKKKTVFGWQYFHLIFLVRDEGWEINTGLLVRFNIVEDIYHQISHFEKKYQKGTHTIGTTIENLIESGRESRFDLYEESQILDLVDKLFELFKSVALPFFDKYDDIKVVDKVLNENTENTLLAGCIHKGFYSLITAKLLNRVDYAQLEQAYQKYYENFANGFYLSEYLKLKDYLNNTCIETK